MKRNHFNTELLILMLMALSLIGFGALSGYTFRVSREAKASDERRLEVLAEKMTIVEKAANVRAWHMVTCGRCH